MDEHIEKAQSELLLLQFLRQKVENSIRTLFDGRWNAETMQLEYFISDMQTVENLIERIRKDLKNEQ